MSFFDKVKSAFVETTPSNESNDTTKPIANNPFIHGLNSTTQTQQQQAPILAQTFVANTNVPRELLDNYVNHFNTLMVDANLPGPDYYEYSKMIDNLGSVPDIRTRHIAAFSGLQAQGVNKEVLLSTANQYISIFEEDKRGFNDALTGKSQQEIEARKQEIDNNDKQIQKNAQIIAELSAQNEQLSVASVTLKNEIAQEQNNLILHEQAYQTCFATAVGRIQNDIQSITTYIS